MGRASKPRAGSLQYWPRKRARRYYPRIRSWKRTNELKLLGFCGYKVGMTHLLVKDSNPHSATKEEQIFTPVTIIECPPLKIYSIRFYKKDDYGIKALTDILNPKLDKEISRKIKLPKKYNKKLEDIKLDGIHDIKLVVYTQPKLTKLEKKKPEIFEISIGSNSINEKLDFAKSLLDKEIKLSDYFKPGQFIDVHAVTKGKGLQGPVKRFGIQLKSHKSEKKRRAPANLGSWHPAKVSFRVPQKGQMGLHTRTMYNNLILDISNDLKKITPKSGFKHYGILKNDYLIIKGSIPGPHKRLIRFSDSIRSFRKSHPINIAYISVKNES
ncbi:50S ribosomal protein L3 [Candidatus Woesearchaeota archaeon]|nr:hypothetical protein [uncultured archaeon]AQS32309.1 hypothetical protein [uncultured archaeon]MBS3149424.1 50S ribosomal protein L3 [Candidatus Woesearchaeota archaeon]